MIHGFSFLCHSFCSSFSTMELNNAANKSCLIERTQRSRYSNLTEETKFWIERTTSVGGTLIKNKIVEIFGTYYIKKVLFSAVATNSEFQLIKCFFFKSQVSFHNAYRCCSHAGQSIIMQTHILRTISLSCTYKHCSLSLSLSLLGTNAHTHAHSLAKHSPIATSTQVGHIRA